MGEHRGGSKIAGYTAIHDGNVESRLTRFNAKDVSKVTKSNVDNFGYYRTVEYFREDNTLSVKSVASNPNADGYYRTLTVTYYDQSGIIISNIVKTVTYDGKGNVQKIE